MAAEIDAKMVEIVTLGTNRDKSLFERKLGKLAKFPSNSRLWEVGKLCRCKEFASGHEPYIRRCYFPPAKIAGTSSSRAR